MIEFNKFYRYNAVLKKAQLYSPPIINLSEGGLPFWTSVHYAVDADNVLGIGQDAPIVRGLGRDTPVVVLFNKPLISLVPGKSIPKAIRFNEVVSKYMRTVPGWSRGDLEPTMLKRKDGVVIYNYGLYSRAVDFQTSTLAGYHKTIGFWNQVVAQVKADAGRVPPKNGVDGIGARTHFIMIEIPTIIPGMKLLNNYANSKENTGYIDKLGTPDRIVLAEIWKWLGGSSDSVFSPLTMEESKKVNILFTYMNSGVLINLYLLRQMAKDLPVLDAKKAPKEIFTGQDMSMLSTVNLQKALLVLLVSFKTKVDAGIVSEVVSEDQLAGMDQEATAEEDLNQLETAILDEEDEDAPSEKSITERFLQDTTDAGEDYESKLADTVRSKVSERLSKKTKDAGSRTS